MWQSQTQVADGYTTVSLFSFLFVRLNNVLSLPLTISVVHCWHSLQFPYGSLEQGKNDKSEHSIPGEAVSLQSWWQPLPFSCTLSKSAPCCHFPLPAQHPLEQLLLSRTHSALQACTNQWILRCRPCTSLAFLRFLLTQFSWFLCTEVPSFSMQTNFANLRIIPDLPRT